MFAIVQALFWYGINIPALSIHWPGNRSIKPNLGIVDAAPSQAQVKLESAGDDEFYFRTHVLYLQNAGDSFGRVTPLKDYDFAHLYDWWVLLDDINADANSIPNMASYYFSATQTPKLHAPYIARYLEQHALRDLRTKWWWLGQAMFQANYKVKDTAWAMRIAEHAKDIPHDVNVPFWIRQMPAIIHEQQGEYKAACNAMLDILDNYKDIPDSELAFMFYFLKERIAAMHERGDWAEDPDIDSRCLRIGEMKL